MKYAAISLLIVFVSCNGTTLTGYRFKTEAEYIAPSLHAQLTLKAEGIVDAGQDLGNGEVSGVLSTTEGKISFKMSDGKMRSVSLNNLPVAYSDSADLVKIISGIFNQQRVVPLDLNELQEIEKVIKASCYGPKATFVKGQTEFLEVVSTEFQRE